MVEAPKNVDWKYLTGFNSEAKVHGIEPWSLDGYLSTPDLAEAMVVQFRGGIDDMCRLAGQVGKRFNLGSGDNEFWPYHVVPGWGFVVVADDGEMFREACSERQFKPKVAFYQAYHEEDNRFTIEMWAPVESEDGQMGLRHETLVLMEADGLEERAVGTIYGFMTEVSRGEVEEEWGELEELGAMRNVIEMFRGGERPVVPDDY